MNVSMRSRRSTMSARWLGLALIFILLIGCSKPTGPKRRSAPVAANPNPGSTVVANPTPTLTADGSVWFPEYIAPTIGDKIKERLNRTVKLGEISSGPEPYSATQARNQQWLRNQIKMGLEQTTPADSPLRDRGLKLTDITTTLDPTEPDKIAAGQMFQELSQDTQNPIIDLEYARFLVRTTPLSLDAETGRLIWSLISRGWSNLPEETSPILKLRYVATQESFARKGGHKEWDPAMRKSVQERARKIIPVVLDSAIPDSEQQFVNVYLQDTAIYWTNNGRSMSKFEPIPANEPNRWLKVMARAHAAGSNGEGATAKEPGPLLIQRACLLDAWTTNPERPEAATGLIRVVARIGGHRGDTPRFWFDQAAQSQFDYMPAYEAYLQTLRAPVTSPLAALFAGGGNAVGKPTNAFLDFCIECMDTGRVDTQVPTFMVKQLDAQTISGSPYEARLREAMTTFMSSPRLTSKQRNYYQTQLAVLDWKSGRHEAAEKQLVELGDNVDAFSLISLKASVAEILEDCAGNLRPNEEVVKESGLWRSSPWRRTLQIGVPRMIRFSPDGKRLAVAGEGTRLELWDTENWSMVPLKGERHAIKAVDFSRDGSTLVTISEDWRETNREGVADGSVILWDVATGQVKSRLTDQYEATAPEFEEKRVQKKPIIFAGCAAAFSPDGKVLITGHSVFAEKMVRNGVVMWNLETSQIWNVSNETKSTVLAIAMTSDGKTLMTGGLEGRTRGWEIPSENEWPRVPGDKQLVSSFALNDPRSHCEGFTISSMAFHPNDKWLAIGIQGFRDSQMELWDISERKLLGIGEGRIVAFSPDGNQLAAETIDRRVVLYDVPGCERRRNFINAHNGAIMSLAYHPSGRYLVAASADGTMSFWDPKTGKPADVGPRE